MNFWRGVVLPAVIPALAVVAVWALSLALLKTPRARLLFPWGLALGYLLVHKLSGGSINWSPVDVTEWLPIIALVSALWGTFAEGTPRRPLVALFSAGILLIVLSAFLLAPLRESTWQGAVGWSATLIAGILWWVLATALSQLGTEEGWAGPLFSALLLAISGGVLFYGHSALLGQLIGSFASAVGVGVLFALILKKFSVGRGGMLMVGILTSSLYLIALTYADLPVHQVSLVILSWLFLSASALQRDTSFPPSWRWVLRLVSLGIALIALILGYTNYMQEREEYSY